MMVYIVTVTQVRARQEKNRNGSRRLVLARVANKRI
jgi:hypothetical protein